MVSGPTPSDRREAGSPAFALQDLPLQDLALPEMPLQGLRVLEMGVLPAASYCARIFADFGADVLKIEPAGGDPGRRLAPLAGEGEGAYFGYLNHNKRSA